MSGTFYCFTYVTVLSELFFGKTVLTLSFHFLCRLLLTNRQLFQTKQNTLYMETFKHLIYFLYLMRLIFLIISNCDQAEFYKSQGKKPQLLLRTHSTFLCTRPARGVINANLVEADKLAIRIWHFETKNQQ